MIDLQVSRKQIDEIDSQIVKLFEERMKVANEVAKYKMETGKAVFDKEREEQKLDSLSKISHGKFNERAVRELFSQIMSISRKYQYGVLPHTDDITDFEKTEKAFDKEQAKVYYFGVPGTHTQQAMEDVFGEAVQGISCQSFQGVMEAVENGQADYGVLPIENSSTGGISTNYDLLLNYKNAIVGEYVMKIDQCLLALPGTKLEDIQTVFSHPQGLLQSRKFMKEHPLFEGVEYGSTAAASNLYSGGLITAGALVAVFLSTSDEMLPIFISEAVPAWTIIKILAVKMVMGILFGFLLDFLYHSIWGRKMRYRNIHTMCESEHCKCDDEGIFFSALRHTIHITIFLFLITLVLEAVIDGVGEEALAGFLMDRPVLGEILAGAIGMVPNCASSVVITQLYLQKVISAGPMMAGLFTNAGVGALVLCRMNRKHVKQNVGILCYLYVAGVVGGILIDLLGINF